MPATRRCGATTRAVLVALGLASGLVGQASAPTPAPSDTDRAINDLRQLTRELNDAVKSFYTHIDQAIARHDRGYRTEDGRQVQSADADLIGGPSDVTWATMQKFVAFRLLAAERSGAPIHDAAATDLERIQQLILETRKRVDATTPVLRRLLVVSVADLDPRGDTAAKAGHDQLLKARGAAEDAARRAMLALPLDQPNDMAAEENTERTWDALGRAMPWGKSSSPNASENALQNAAANATAIPVLFERRKRVTLFNEGAYRMAMTDSGVDDEQGRHIFYQEEWVQRGQSVIRYRWRVGVDAATGEHILLKRYPPRELQGAIEEVYKHRDRDYVWYLEPPADSTEPNREEIEEALAGVARAREAVRASAQDFKTSIREALTRQDRQHALMNDPAVDSALPEGLRMRLFAIRAHMARVQAVLATESAVRRSVSDADAAVRDLEPLAAWANRTAAPDWAQLLDRYDRDIDSVRNAESEALHGLPPDSAHAEDEFPELEKNTIIRIRRPHSKNPEDTSVHCLQEVWRMEIGPLGTREVKRSVSLILVDPATGMQTRVGGATRYYKVSDGDLLEDIFDEYAADEVSLGS